MANIPRQNLPSMLSLTGATFVQGNLWTYLYLSKLSSHILLYKTRLFSLDISECTVWHTVIYVRIFLGELSLLLTCRSSTVLFPLDKKFTMGLVLQGTRGLNFALRRKASSFEYGES